MVNALTRTAKNVSHNRKSIRNATFYGMQETFDDLYSRSKDNQQFRKLYDIIISRNNILLAYRTIKSNQGSKTSGVNKTTIEDINGATDTQIVSYVRERLENFEPNIVKRVLIPKPNGDTRPLGIPTIEDRLIQQCIKQVLEPICEAKFHPHSYGFRPNRSVTHAMGRVASLTNVNNLHYCISVDIKGFFDNINHGKLLKQLWTIGIHDKKVISIISKMLKAEYDVEGEATKGTPQGGILSPLLANVVLNELDWWISNQWETFETKHDYTLIRKRNGKEYIERSGKYRALRTSSKMKEMYIVRYADDFKIFCRNYKDAFKVQKAVTEWLHTRLKLETSEKKSKVTNLRRNSDEFLGFRLKVVPNKKKHTLRTFMTKQAKQNAVEKLKDQVKYIQRHPRSKEVFKMNSMILGLQNYYKTATMVSRDFAEIAYLVERTVHNRMKKNIRRKGNTTEFYKKQYPNWKNYKPIFLYGVRLYNISDVRCDVPMKFSQEISNYTSQGRDIIHKKNKSVSQSIINYLVANPIQSQSVEYNDNRLSKFVAQKGKCSVTGNVLEINEMECHHKLPRKLGGTDAYENLTFITKTVHKLIHATKPETINKLLCKLNLDESSINSINKLRVQAGNIII